MDALEREGRFDFTCITPPPKAAHISAERGRPGPWFLTWRTKHENEHSRFPRQVRCSPRGSFPLHPIQRTESRAAPLGAGKTLGEWQGALKGCGSRNCSMPLVHHQEAQPRATGEGLTVILPNLPMGTPSALCDSPTQLLVCGPWCGQLLVHTLKGRKNKLWLMASKHCRKSARICRAGSNHRFEL